MTSKNLFFKLLKEDVKRRLWVAALTFLVFFFSFPVRVALEISGYEKENRWKCIIEIGQWLSVYNLVLVFLIIILATILGVTSFSYLHSKQKIDFYHSVPVRRETLFFVNFLDGILIPAAAYLINILLALLIAVLNGVATGSIISAAFGSFLFFMLHYMMLYSVTVLAMMMTGNIVVGILGTGVFHFYFPMLIVIISYYYQEFFETSYRGGNEFFNWIQGKCSALVLFVDNVGLWKITSTAEHITRIIAVLFIFVAVTLLSLILYKKRGSEAAGKAMAFKISQSIIRIPIVILAALSGGVFFWGLRSTLSWAIFGMICGLVLSHCIVEIIYHFDFKRLFANRIQMILCAVVAVVIFSGFHYDIFRYDRYMPKENSIKSVAVSNIESWVDYGSARKNKTGDYVWDYVGSNEYLFSHMEMTDYDAVLAFVKAYHEPRESVVDEFNYQDSLSVQYTLKNGRQVRRSYLMPKKLFQEKITQIYDNPQYKAAVYPLLNQLPEETAKVRIIQNDWTKDINSAMDSEQDSSVRRLLLTYQDEFKNLKSDTMKQEEPIGQILFMTDMQVEAENAQLNQDSQIYSYNDVAKHGKYPIYPSFTKTIALLKELDVNLESETDVNKVTEINIEAYQLLDDAAYRGDKVPSIIIKNPTEIGQMMEFSKNGEYCGMNPFGNDQSDISFSITVDGKNLRKMEYRLAKENIPDFLAKQIEEIKAKAIIVSD